jgi:hypothetical protein
MPIMVKVEKMPACNLRAGDLFVFDLDQNGEWFEKELNGTDVALVVMLRTNVEDSDLDDREVLVNKLTIEYVGEERPSKATMDPHLPPGFNR